MKKTYYILLLVAVLLTACGGAPTQAPAPAVIEPSPTPVVLVQTFVVEATAAPTEAIPPTPVVVTVVVQPTAEPATQAPAPTADPNAAASTSTVVNVDNVIGKGVFTNIAFSDDEVTLRCTPREITVTATAALVDITEAELWYRIVDQPKALYYSEWKNMGKMEKQGNGVFTFVISGESVHPDLRLDLGWLEFQIVGLNKGGAAVDRTDKIEQLITYRIDCP